MKVESKGNTIVIKMTSNDIDGFVRDITEQYPTYATSNIIADLSPAGHLPVKNLTLFGELIKQHKKAKKSFVLVADTDYNKSAKYNTVPTLQEAFDLIEMDEMERDLGF